VAPAGGERLAVALRLQCPAEERDPEPVDVRAQVREQRRQQRDRGEHHDQDGQRGRDRHGVHVRQAGQEQAEHGDHHRAPRDDRAAPSGRDGLDHGVVTVLAGVHRRPEPSQHEQRVVDADADPDQPRHRRCPVGNGDDVGEQHDQATRGDAEADERDHQRQAGGDHRAERDQQHDRGAEEPNPLRARRLLSAVNRISAELDLKPATAVGLGRGDQLLALLLLDLPARDRQRERGRTDRAVPRHPDRRVLGDVLDLLGVGEERVDALSGAGSSRAGRILPDHVDLLTGVAAEALFGQLARRLRLRSRRVVIGVVLPRQRRTSRDYHHRSGDPRQHHPAATAVGDIGEPGQTTRHYKPLLLCAANMRSSAFISGCSGELAAWSGRSRRAWPRWRRSSRAHPRGRRRS
jgi:hypothetical protein